MRLTKYEIQTIKGLALTHFGNDAKVYLFGSRIDDNKKGGDIDIYIELGKGAKYSAKKKIHFLVDLKNEIGDQKIDTLIDSGNKKNNQLVYKIARQEGIRL